MSSGVDLGSSPRLLTGVAVLESGLSTLRSATVSPSGRLAATYGVDVLLHLLIVWDLTESAELGRTHLRQAPLAARFSADGQTIAVTTVDPQTGDAEVTVWSTDRLYEAATPVYRTADVAGVSMSRNGEKVAFRGRSSGVTVLDVPTGRVVNLPLPSVRGVAISPTGRRVAVDLDGRIDLYDVGGSGVAGLVYQVEFGPVQSMDCGETRLVVASQDSISAFAGPVPYLVSRGWSGVRRVALSASERVLAVAPDGGGVSLIDVGRGGVLAAVAAPSPVRRLTFSPDDALLVTAHEDEVAQIWDAGGVDPGPPAAPNANDPALATSAPGAPAGPLALAGGFDDDQRGRRDDQQRLVDELGVRPYAIMLGALIAGEQTSLPLSIGLFGAWGSGKSYFMDLLKDEVAAAAAGSGRRGRTIVQLTFNAWQYSDTNLWASLGAEFFDQLLGPHEDQEVDARRDRIRLDLEKNNQLAQELAEARQKAVERVGELRGQLAEVEGRRRHDTRARDAALLKRVLEDQDVKAQLDQLQAQLQKLGIDVPVDQAMALVGQLQASRDDAAGLWGVLRGHRWRGTFWLVVAAMAVLVAAVAASGTVAHWLGAGSVSLLVVALGALGRRAGQARDVINTSRALAQQVDQVSERVRAEPTPEEQRTAAELEVAEGEAAVLQRGIDATIEAAAGFDRELAELRPGRRLHQFIAERADSTEYRSQLGIIATVRRDFADLQRLMRAEWPDDAVDDRIDRIDRIVLYIDDLDRCDPHQVVAVLQAVNLLLAMDLFVVVVGVDPRWLLRSLRAEYDQLLGGDGGDGDGGYWTSTPQNYLEKIFQVPFVLPGMDKGGFTRLLQGLAGADAPPGPPDSGVGAPPSAGGPATPGSSGEASDAPSQRLEFELLSEVGQAAQGQATVAALPLTTEELDFFSGLHELLPTPRTAKRLFNIYRMLRSTRDLWPGTSTFLGSAADRPGEYEAVAQLLAILSSYPAELGWLMWGRKSDGGEEPRALCRQPVAASWPAFVDGLEPQLIPQSTSVPSAAIFTNQVADRIDANQAVRWRELTGSLRRVVAHVRLVELEPYRQWAPRVARFSFLLSEFADDEPASPVTLG